MGRRKDEILYLSIMILELIRLQYFTKNYDVINERQHNFTFKSTILSANHYFRLHSTYRKQLKIF